MSEPLSAVVVAAGRSQRMGFDKLLTPLGGRPLLLHTLERLLLAGTPEEIILVIRPGSHAEMEATIAPLRDQGNIRLVDGGAQRQDSVQAGLRAVSNSSEFVMVHDAARPFVTKELVDTVLAALDSVTPPARYHNIVKRFHCQADGATEVAVHDHQRWSVVAHSAFHKTAAPTDKRAQTIVVENFYADPEAVLKYALRQPYYFP